MYLASVMRLFFSSSNLFRNKELVHLDPLMSEAFIAYFGYKRSQELQFELQAGRGLGVQKAVLHAVH